MEVRGLASPPCAFAFTHIATEYHDNDKINADISQTTDEDSETIILKACDLVKTIPHSGYVPNYVTGTDFIVECVTNPHMIDVVRCLAPLSEKRSLLNYELDKFAVFDILEYTDPTIISRVKDARMKAFPRIKKPERRRRRQKNLRTLMLESLNGTHGEYTNSDDVEPKRRFRNKKSHENKKMLNTRKEKLPTLYLTVSPIISWSNLNEVPHFEDISQFGILAGVLHLKFSIEESLVKTREFLKGTNSYIVRSSFRCSPHVEMKPIADYSLPVEAPPNQPEQQGEEDEGPKADPAPVTDGKEDNVNTVYDREIKIIPIWDGIEESSPYNRFTQEYPWDEWDDSTFLNEFGYVCQYYKEFMGANWTVKFVNSETRKKKEELKYDWDYFNKMEESKRYFKLYISKCKIVVGRSKHEDEPKDLPKELTERLPSLDAALEIYYNKLYIKNQRKKTAQRRMELYRLYQGEEFEIVHCPHWDEICNLKPFEWPKWNFGKASDLITKTVPENPLDKSRQFISSFKFAEHFGVSLSSMSLYHYDTVEFSDPIEYSTKDERFLSNAHGDIKHQARYCKARIIQHYTSFGLIKRREREVVISLELFAQMLSPSNYNVGDSFATNAERMKRCCRNMAAVNISKNFVHEGEDVNNNTFEIACFYIQGKLLAVPEKFRGGHLNL